MVQDVVEISQEAACSVVRLQDRTDLTPEEKERILSQNQLSKDSSTDES